MQLSRVSHINSKKRACGATGSPCYNVKQELSKSMHQNNVKHGHFVFSKLHYGAFEDVVGGRGEVAGKEMTEDASQCPLPGAEAVANVIAPQLWAACSKAAGGRGSEEGRRTDGQFLSCQCLFRC